jgi:hypothetical protein
VSGLGRSSRSRFLAEDEGTAVGRHADVPAERVDEMLTKGVGRRGLAVRDEHLLRVEIAGP